MESRQLSMQVMQVPYHKLYFYDIPFKIYAEYFIIFMSYFYYVCDFVVRDIKIAVYLESPRKINFKMIFLVSKISQKRILTINNKIVIYLDL